MEEETTLVVFLWFNGQYIDWLIRSFKLQVYINKTRVGIDTFCH